MADRVGLYCAYAWHGMYIAPNGDMSSCCDQLGVGVNSSTHTIPEAYHSEQFNRIRERLLRGEEVPECEKCWRKERVGLPSSRTNNINMVPRLPMQSQSELETTHISMWDIRDNNLCNMSCRMCGSGCSSMWNQETITHKDNPNYTIRFPMSDSIVTQNNDQEHILQTFRDNLEHCTLVYFAGGEPLINDTHWKILDIILEAGRTDIFLRYNTNLLKTTYRGRDAIDIWEQFDHTPGVSVSIDAIGDRAEYSRTGTVWETIDNNLRRTVKLYPDLQISITPSILTLAGMTETIDYCVGIGIKPNRIFYSNVVYTPKYLCANLLPKSVKQHYLKQLESYDTVGYEQLKAVLDTEGNPLDRNKFVKFTRELDAVRGTDIITAAPELAEYMESWT